MSLETMNAGNQARAAKAYTDWEAVVPQIGSAVTQLTRAMQAAESHYQVVRDNTDEDTAASYAADAAAVMGPVLAAKKAELIAFIEWVATATGQTVAELLAE